MQRNYVERDHRLIIQNMLQTNWSVCRAIGESRMFGEALHQLSWAIP